MKTTVKHLSDTKVELTISVGHDELDAAEQVALTKLASEVKAPGFRKGKTPVIVAAKYVDPNALSQQTLEDALSKAVAEAFTAEDIRALDRPAVEVKKYVPHSELEFTAEVEILPEVKLGNYKKLKSKQETVKVTAAEIDEVIERTRKGFSTKKEVKRGAKDGDEAVIDFVGKKDGVAFDGGTGNDYPLTLGSGSFIPGFEEGIVGHKAGETFDLELTFPGDYHSKNLAGAKVTFTTTLTKLYEIALPDIDDKLAKKAGEFKTLKEWQADVKRELTEQKEKKAKEALKDALVTELITVSTVPAPEVLIKDQEKSIEQDMTQNLMYQGMSLDQYIETRGFKTKEEWLDKEVHDAAEKRVQAGLALAELSKAEKIEATEAELEEHVNLYKTQYASRPEVLKQLETSEARRDIANRLLTEKTVDHLVELNT